MLTVDRVTGLEPVVSLGEAAARLNVSVNRLGRYAAAGQVPGAVKLFGTWRIPVAVLDQILSGQVKMTPPRNRSAA
jgi:predicted site-specific integrase-resolvase